jgi:hypothetical protein
LNARTTAGVRRTDLHEHMHVIWQQLFSPDLPAMLVAARRYTCAHDSPPILRAPHQVQAQ